MPRDRTDPDPDQIQMPIPGGFRAAFTAALREVGLTVRQWQGASVICLNGDGEERTLSLNNVYRRAQNAPRENWPDIIQEFVQNMSAATDQARLPERLEEAADQI